MIAKSGGAKENAGELVSTFDPVEPNLIMSNPPHNESVVVLLLIAGASDDGGNNWSGKEVDVPSKSVSD